MERVRRRAVIFPGCPGGDHPRIWIYLVLIAFMLGFIISCSGSQVQKSQAKGVYHVVKKGETAYSIARAYSLSLQDLVEINNISDVSTIKEGMVIFIPDANQVIDDVMDQARKAGADARRDVMPEMGSVPDQPKPAKPAEKPEIAEKTPIHKSSSTEVSGIVAPAPVPKSVEKPPDVEQEEDVKVEKGRFVWPVKGVVKSRFGIQPNKTYHNWIKIVCPAGTRIKAAAAGTVIFSASLKDFGETIIIRHVGDFATVYTHVKKRQAKADQNVKRGDHIALAGEKDDRGDTYINFEIRLKGKARNPLFYLP